jgi:hypothetical protein
VKKTLKDIAEGKVEERKEETVLRKPWGTEVNVGTVGEKVETEER